MDVWETLQKRHEINEKIAKLTKEINLLKRIRERLEQVQSMIDRELEAWEEEYDRYCNIALAPDIKVTDSFEGLSAEQLAVDFPPTVDEVNNIAGQAGRVSFGISGQLTKIDRQIAQLNSKIAGLRSELAALG